MPERTFAIIKPAFLDQRLDIETLLGDAGFDTIKERQIEFHPDDENLGELFGDEAPSLKGGPVRVYVLEKDNAVQDLLALVGDQDPAVARELAPQSIRALYGSSLVDNVIYAAPDAELADIQISSIFVSSPPFPPAELDDTDIFDQDEAAVLTDTGLHNRELSYDSVASESKVTRGGENGQFRARAVPSTTAVPSIAPRMSRAAALRAGLVETKVVAVKPRGPLSKEEMARTFANVPGHKRSATIAVASTAPPVIAPRATRASMLRTGQMDQTQAPIRPRASTTNLNSDTPGYKRNLKLNVPSTAPPVIQPRQTRASVLRTGQPGGAPSPPKLRSRPSTAGAAPASKPIRPKTEGTFVGVPGHKRAESIQVASTRTPAAPPRLNRSAELRARKMSEESKSPPPPIRRATSTAAISATDSKARTTAATASSMRLTSSSTKARPPIQQRGRSGAPEAGPPSSYRRPRETSTSPPRSESQAGGRQSRPSSVASVRRAPSIEPKTNRAALLRARAGTPVGRSNQPKFVWV